MKLHEVLTCCLALAFVAACSEAPTDILHLQERAQAPGNGKGGGNGGSDGGDDGGSLKSECGGKTDLLDSRVSLDWSESSAVQGDTEGDVFDGGQGSVHAKAFYHDQICSRSGDIVFDADMNGKGKNTRHLTFHFPDNRPAGLDATVASAPFVNFLRAMQLGSDVNGDGEVNGRDAKIEAKNPGSLMAVEHPDPADVYPGQANLPNPDRRFRFTLTGISGCNVLEYVSVAITRTAGRFDAISEDLGEWSPDLAGEWTAESRSTSDGGAEGHWARCLVSSGGSTEANGALMDMPFKVKITEKR